MYAHPFSIRILLIVIALAFSAGSFFGLYRIHSLQQQINADPAADGVWPVSGDDGRLLVLLDVLQQYIRDPGPEREQLVKSEFDIVESRLNVLTRGRARQPAESDPTYGNVIRRFNDGLQAVDGLMSPLTPESAVKAYTRLEALRAPLQELLSHVSQTAAEQKAAATAWVVNWTDIVAASLFVVLLSGGGAIFMLYLENRRATREMQHRAHVEIRLRAAKLEAERGNEAKSAFIANMSHELRTPLNAVIGFAELIKIMAANQGADGKIREYADDIRSSGTYLLELLSDILDLSAIEAGKFEMHETDFDIGDFLRKCAVDFEQTLNGPLSAFKIDIPAVAMPFRGDRRRVKQVLTNLLSNAFKFTSTDGMVVLAVRLSDDGGVVMTVTDTGPGIPADKLDVVFRPFQQISDDAMKSQMGTGLGLGIVKQLVEMHQGAVMIESNLGSGTRVLVSFPPYRCGRDD